MGREADTLPAKIQKALAGGESDGAYITQEDLEKAKDLYYTMAGWEVATGNPTREKLESLGLGWVGEKKDQ
jgi:aldehyde:ferredoxin oxidoreductase